VHAQEDLATLAEGARAPGGKGVARGVHGLADLLGVEERRLREGAARRGIDRGPPARSPLDLAVGDPGVGAVEEGGSGCLRDGHG
jgi:hypothetical protein